MVHAFEDYTQGLPMEIGNSYMPLPEVLPPNNVHFPLDVIEEQHTFDAERTALHAYGAHLAAALARAADIVSSADLGPQCSGHPDSAAASHDGTASGHGTGTVNGSMSDGKPVATAPPPYIGSGGVLVPTPVAGAVLVPKRQDGKQSSASSARFASDDAQPSSVGSTPLKASVSSPDICAKVSAAADAPQMDTSVDNVPSLSQPTGWPDLFGGDCKQAATEQPSTSMMDLFDSKSVRTEPESDSFQSRVELPTTDSERKLISAVASIGLDSEAALRFARRHGRPIEQRAVIDYLLATDAVSSRQPNLPVDIVEEAVYVCDGDADKAVQYARVAAQLNDLGFGPTALLAAIRKSDGRRDRALDLLLSGTFD